MTVAVEDEGQLPGVEPPAAQAVDPQGSKLGQPLDPGVARVRREDALVAHLIDGAVAPRRAAHHLGGQHDLQVFDPREFLPAGLQLEPPPHLVEPEGLVVGHRPAGHEASKLQPATARARRHGHRLAVLRHREHLDRGGQLLRGGQVVDRKFKLGHVHGHACDLRVDIERRGGAIRGGAPFHHSHYAYPAGRALPTTVGS